MFNQREEANFFSHLINLYGYLTDARWLLTSSLTFTFQEERGKKRSNKIEGQHLPQESRTLLQNPGDLHLHVSSQTISHESLHLHGKLGHVIG